MLKQCQRYSHWDKITLPLKKRWPDLNIWKVDAILCESNDRIMEARDLSLKTSILLK